MEVVSLGWGALLDPRFVYRVKVRTTACDQMPKTKENQAIIDGQGCLL